MHKLNNNAFESLNILDHRLICAAHTTVVQYVYYIQILHNIKKHIYSCLVHELQHNTPACMQSLQGMSRTNLICGVHERGRLACRKSCLTASTMICSTSPKPMKGTRSARAGIFITLYTWLSCCSRRSTATLCRDLLYCFRDTSSIGLAPANMQTADSAVTLVLPVDMANTSQQRRV